MAVSRSAVTLFIALCVFLPTRAQPQLEFDVVENTGDGYFVGQPLKSGGTSFRFVDSSCNCSRFFTIDPSSSSITTRGNLDREQVVRIERSDRLNCIVRYSSTSTISEGHLVLSIHVLDVNDETPSFFNLDPVHIINVLENIGIPNPIQSLQPVDNDKGFNGTVVFNITHGNEQNVFQIDRPVGDIDPSSTARLLYVNKHLDFEREKQFNLTITIMDMGVPVHLSFNQTLIVNVEDSNDELPTFITSRYSFEVPEDHPLDVSIGNITANDLDSSGTVLYTIYSNPNMSSITEPIIYEFIRVDVNTGDIFLIQHIDYDTNNDLRDFNFYVQARNPGQNAVTIATVNVNIMDTNDEPPYFVCESCQSSSNTRDHLTIFVEENEANLPLILPVFTVKDDDSVDTFRNVNSSILVEFEPHILAMFKLLQLFTTTRVRVGINQTLDREMTPNLTLSLTARNTAEPPLSGTSTIFIIVTDQNDNAPQFLHNPFRTRIPETAPVGKEVLTVVAWDEDAGENSTLSFAITGVDKSQARGWFSINQSSGRISVSSGLDYNSVAGHVTLTVTAVDHGRSPLSNTTRVEITLSPAVTFAQRSFQEYSGYNFFLGERESVYLEFQTTQSQGLLLYQAGLPTKIFTLEIVDGNVRCQLESGGQVSDTNRDTPSVSNDRWHSVLVERNREDITLSVWVTDQQAPSETSRLQDSTLAECGARQEGGSEHSLYVGGVDLFALPSNTTLYPDFVGSIRNVIIGTTQLDLACPSREENTVQGFHRASSCESASLSCTGAHTTGCVDYARQPYCSCLGGFNLQTCQQEESYAPIKFQGNAKAEINLGYSFFYDLATAEPPTSLGPQRRRRRRNTGEEGFMQIVEVSFRPVEVSTGLLLYSRTQSYIHVLEIDQDQVNMQVITYSVFDVGYSMAVVHIPLNIHLAARGLYTAIITSTSSEATLTLETNGTLEVPPKSQRFNPVPPFAQQPQTLVSIGGASDPNPNAPLYENFTGCISRVAINRIELPLSGLLNAPGEGGLSTVGSVEASCDLCTPSPCGASMQCVSDQFGSYDCLCPVGSVLTDTQDGCSPVTNTPTSDVTAMVTTSGLMMPTPNTFPFYYIIVSAAGGLIVIGCVIFVFIMVARCGYNKYEKKKRTYHINNEEVGNGHVPVAKPNFYTTVIPKPSSSESSNHEHSIGSVSTYHEHDIPDDMVDTEIDNPPPFSRRRSTTSAESGIKTDTERDDKSIGGYPRMEDSGNEKETDYSPPESESDDVTSSCMETALSPSGLNLAGSTSSVMGIPTHVPPPHVPLTPKERKALTPLRPDSSTILSMSEFDDETDMETDVSYRPVPPRPHRALGNRSSESDCISRTSPSEPGTPKWYKSSTASDTEREKLRAQGTRPYYPTNSEPPRTYFPRKAPPPPSHPPDYKSPPTFVQRKNSTPSYSSQRPHLQTVDSPLSRSLKHAYRSVPHSPLSAQPQNNPQLTHTPELLSKSQPNRFQYPSATIPHCRLNSPQACPYQFASTSAPYHPRSFSGGDAPHDPPSQQQFQDLKSVSRINPISYWEMQDRMKSTVDQVDPYHILSEPYVQFEDVSTDPSVTESQLTLEESDRPEHQAFSSQGGGEGTADLLDLSLMRLQDGDIDSMVTDGPEIGPPITHFPSADCSEEYTHSNSLVTLVASSRDASPKQLSSGLSNGFVMPSSQEPFDV